MPILLGLLLAAASASKADDLKLFKDWTATCDNVLRCEAQGLIPDAVENGFVLEFAREAGPGARPTLEVVGAERTAAASIDGKRVALKPGQGDTLAFPDGAAAAALANAHRMTMIDAKGKPLGTVSLAGMAAALRWIDERQGRSGGVTALFAKGPAPASAVPAPPAAPVIVAPTPVAGAGRKPTPAEIKRMMDASQCDPADNAERKPDVYALAAGATLVLLPCGAGAYNYLTVPFVAEGKAPFRIAAFDHSVGFSEPGGPPMLVNADYDPKSGELASYAKGRGLGDCGSEDRFVWDGTRFRLTEQHAMGECRGSTDWMRTWTAQVRWR